MTIGSAIVLIAIGAILKWAITAHISGIDLQTAGTVLLVIGILGLILAIAYTFSWSRGRTRDVRMADERDPRYDPPPRY
jgi:hypothetical protein